MLIPFPEGEKLGDDDLPVLERRKGPFRTEDAALDALGDMIVKPDVIAGRVVRYRAHCRGFTTQIRWRAEVFALYDVPAPRGSRTRHFTRAQWTAVAQIPGVV